MRLVISRKQKESALNEHKHMLERMHEEFELKRAAWGDVREYEEEEKRKRRDRLQYSSAYFTRHFPHFYIEHTAWPFGWTAGVIIAWKSKSKCSEKWLKRMRMLA